MQDFIGKKIVLGICGGIAAYKSAYLVRELCRLGAEVRVVMTANAQQFIGSLTLQALSGHEVRTTLWDEQAESGMGHIELARWADYFLVAPASANLLAKFAQGLADDLLSTLYLATDKPVILCPAMNKNMWEHPATKDNVARLRTRGVRIVGPEPGEQACGELGLGRLAESDAIINALRLVALTPCLLGKELIITAASTHEALDPVRFISNRSSGKMAYALALAATIAGARVTLISGPSRLSPPESVQFIPVVSAEDMYEQVMAELKPGCIFIGCAAVADFSPLQKAVHKIKKQANQGLELKLMQTKDIIAAVSASGLASLVVGFAAETASLLANARKKLATKKLDMVIANQVGERQGFDQDDNEVTVITKNAEFSFPPMHKVRLAGELISLLATTF